MASKQRYCQHIVCALQSQSACACAQHACPTFAEFGMPYAGLNAKKHSHAQPYNMHATACCWFLNAKHTIRFGLLILLGKHFKCVLCTSLIGNKCTCLIACRAKVHGQPGLQTLLPIVMVKTVPLPCSSTAMPCVEEGVQVLTGCITHEAFASAAGACTGADLAQRRAMCSTAKLVNLTRQKCTQQHPSVHGLCAVMHSPSSTRLWP